MTWKERAREWSAPVALGLGSGVLTLLLGYCFAFTIGGAFPAQFREVWIRWDTVHYLNIAVHGYSAEAASRALICFFPLYPLLIRAFAWIVQDPFWAGIIVSNAAFATALVYLRKLVALDFDLKTADLAVVFCVFFPTAYFFHAIYGESVFLLLSVTSLYAARRGNWWLAGLLAFGASTARLPGAALGPALLLEYLHSREFDWRRIRPDILAVFSPVLAVALYLFLNFRVFGDPFAFLTVQQEVFSRELAPPWEGLSYDFHALFSSAANIRFTMQVEQIACFVLTTALLIWSARRLRPSYTLYTAILWALTFCYNFWMSVPRFVLVFLPVYFFLGITTAQRPNLRYLTLFAFALIYTLGMVQFCLARWAH